MTLKEYNEKWKKSISDFEDSLGDTMVAIGNNALALIKQRVQETGVDAKGQKFTKYSTDGMFVGSKSMNNNVARSFFGKQNNKKHKWVTLQRGGKNYRLAVLENGYKELRELHGRQAGYVDFTFYGKMWGDIAIISEQSLHSRGFVIIGAKTEEQAKILQGNTNRRGPILELSEKELQELSGEFNTSINQIMRNNGL